MLKTVGMETADDTGQHRRQSLCIEYALKTDYWGQNQRKPDSDTNSFEQSA